MPKEIKTFSICEDANGDNARTICEDADYDYECFSMKTTLSILTGAHSFHTGIKMASMYSLPFDCTTLCPKKN